MIASIEKLRPSGNCSYMVLQAPAMARKAKPGQFVEIKVTGDNAPFWRRPFSICRAHSGKLELLIKTVGPGTQLISQMQAGDSLDVIGPLGHGFTCSGKSPMLLVGGGFGVAPLLFLAEKLRQQNRVVEVLVGGRCEKDLVLRREIKRAGATLVCTTEDGSYGTPGLITEVLQQRLELCVGKLMIAAAGPYPMLRVVAALARKFSVPAEVSLEEIMACGLGVCNGCVVKVGKQYQQVCKDGPVFNASEVEWE